MQITLEIGPEGIPQVFRREELVKVSQYFFEILEITPDKPMPTKLKLSDCTTDIMQLFRLWRRRRTLYKLYTRMGFNTYEVGKDDDGKPGDLNIEVSLEKLGKVADLAIRAFAFATQYKIPEFAEACFHLLIQSLQKDYGKSCLSPDMIRNVFAWNCAKSPLRRLCVRDVIWSAYAESPFDLAELDSIDGFSTLYAQEMQDFLLSAVKNKEENNGKDVWDLFLECDWYYRQSYDQASD